MKVIVISGRAQHGKDTTAGFMKELLEARSKKVLIAHYGDLVKYVCKTFFDWDGQKDEKGRTMLQQVGTERIRNNGAPDYWVSFIADILKFFPNEWDYVLIPDCRFPNEVEYLQREFAVTHVRVVRENFKSPLTEEQQKHPSETALDNYPPDILLINRGDLTDLKYAVSDVVDRLIYPVAKKTTVIATAYPEVGA